MPYGCLDAMEVRFLASGEKLAGLAADEFEGKTARAVKEALAKQVGVTRFRQRFFSEDGSEIVDDEVFASAPMNVNLVILQFHPPDAEQNQQIISASTKNDFLALEKLLKNPLNPNVTDDRGRTPLHHASKLGHVESVRLLLDAGADKNAETGTQKITPLLLAAWRGHLDVVRHLVEVGAHKNQTIEDGATPLFMAAGWGHLDVVRHLLQLGADKDPATNDGATPLIVAAEQGHVDVVRYLVEVGARIDQTMKHGATPVFIAAQNGYLDIVRYLVQVGACKESNHE